MRNAFSAEITALTAQDERVILLSGDIGNRLFDDLKARSPKQFINCGVAEANMISMAAGMAMSGLRPFAYTINSFITTRCLEQIRVDVCYHNVPVTIVGVGAGLSYASLGSTHHSCEDISILRVLPHMTVICPGDPIEVRLAMRAALQHDGPVYIRLGKKGEPVVHQQPPPFVIGKGIIVRRGRDACLLSSGNMLSVAMQASDVLARQGVTAQVVSLHTVKPLDRDLLFDVFSTFKAVLTVEEHSVLGGVGGSVAEWLADQPPQKGRLHRIGTADEFLHEAGDQEDARRYFGLTAQHIADKALQLLSGQVAR